MTRLLVFGLLTSLRPEIAALVAVSLVLLCACLGLLMRLVHHLEREPETGGVVRSPLLFEIETVPGSIHVVDPYRGLRCTKWCHAFAPRMNRCQCGSRDKAGALGAYPNSISH